MIDLRTTDNRAIPHCTRDAKRASQHSAVLALLKKSLAWQSGTIASTYRSRVPGAASQDLWYRQKCSKDLPKTFRPHTYASARDSHAAAGTEQRRNLHFGRYAMAPFSETKPSRLQGLPGSCVVVLESRNQTSRSLRPTILSLLHAELTTKRCLDLRETSHSLTPYIIYDEPSTRFRNSSNPLLRFDNAGPP